LPDGELRVQIQARVMLSLVLTLGFILIEALAGLLVNSLALLTDAAHNLTDVMALALTWFALKQQARSPGAANTYGFHRVGILVALVNSATLVLVSLGVLYEAGRRFLNPTEVRGEALVVIGLLAVVVNLVTALVIRRGSEADLNLRSAFVHLMGDVASTAAAVVAGAIIYFTGAHWLDPLVGAFIGLLIIYSAWKILREAVDILLESTPRDVDLSAMVRDVLRVGGVLGIHDLHVWSLAKDLRTMSAHVLTDDVPISAGNRIHNEIRALLAERYGIAHSTLQLESVGCDSTGLYCRIQASAYSRQK